MRSELKPGDHVLIQFGHNDGGPPDKDRARGSLSGTGDESQEFTLPNGSRETVYTFGHYMREMISKTKAAGADPIVLSLTVRNIWKDGKVERGPGQFGKWSAEIAKAQGVSFVDVTNAIADQYEKMGEAKVKAWFPEDHTHTSAEGADFNASVVVAGLKGITSPLVAMLSEKGKVVERYPVLLSTDRLNLPSPEDPKFPTLFLIGDSTVRNGRGMDRTDNGAGASRWWTASTRRR